MGNASNNAATSITIKYTNTEKTAGNAESGKGTLTETSALTTLHRTKKENAPGNATTPYKTVLNK